MRVGAQITEAIRTHRQLSKAEAREQAIELLRLVRMPAAERRFHEYPHQLSGGMRQRVMIAIALACRPRLLIADEATTALDVTTQAQIMELLLDLQDQLGMSLIMISHDLGLAASYADEVIVMYGGKVVEQGPAAFGVARVHRDDIGSLERVSENRDPHATPSHLRELVDSHLPRHEIRRNQSKLPYRREHQLGEPGPEQLALLRASLDLFFRLIGGWRVKSSRLATR